MLSVISSKGIDTIRVRRNHEQERIARGCKNDEKVRSEK